MGGKPLDPDIENVLLVTVDCLRYDRFGRAVEAGLTDALSGLTDAGVVFENAFTVANATDPSLTSFMTATYPHTHGVVENGWGLDEDVPVVAEEIVAAGFDTFGVVSVDHLSHEHSGLGRGFDAYHSGRGYDTLYPFLSRIYDTKTFNFTFGAVKDLGIGHYTVKSLLRSLGLIRLHCRTGESVTDEATAELDRVEPPFFGWVHYFDMHEPRNYRREFLPELDEYTASMIEIDGFVTRLLATLEDRGLRENTLVVLTADHGENLNDHGYTGHGRTLYDEELHVPLVFVHPELEGQSVDAQVRTIDIAPTILDIIGIDSPESFEGESLSPALHGGPIDDRDVFATAYPEFSDAAAVRSGEYKLIRDGDEYELYDLTADPGETSDLSDDDDYSSVRATLAGKLHSWANEGTAAEEQRIDARTEEMLEDLGYID